MRSKFTQDLEQNVQVMGEGEDILLIMGQGARGRVWHSYQAPELVAAGYRVITYDNLSVTSDRPYSFQDIVDEASQILDEYADGPAVVAGTSLGASITAALAAQRPTMVRGAVLCALAGVLPEKQLVKIGSATTPEAFSGLNLSPMTLSNPSRRRTWNQLIEYSVDMNRPLGNPPCDQREHWSLESMLRNIQATILNIVYADDHVVPPSLSHYLASLIPNSQVEELANTGHWGYLERPEAFNQLFLDFLANLQ